MPDPRFLGEAGGPNRAASGAARTPPERWHPRDATVLLAGLGNIGSFAAPLLARAGVGSIGLVDRDRVETDNIVTQNFDAAEDTIGRPKAEVLAGRLSKSFPGTDVEAIVADVEELPLGVVAGADVVLGALDSRRARQALLIGAAWPLGVPAVDGAVGEGLLGRVQTYFPGESTACIMCTWGKEDFRRLAQENSCTDGSAVAPPTRSPAFAGATVAAMMAAECVGILAGESPRECREIAFDLAHRRFRSWKLRRAAACRYGHEVASEVLRLEVDFNDATVEHLLGALARRFPGGEVQLEFRRGLPGTGPFASRRFLGAESLRSRESMRLAALGLRPADLVEARADDRFVLVALGSAVRQPESRSSQRTSGTSEKGI